MNIARRLSEAPAGLRWHRGRAMTALIHRRAFGHLGKGTVLVAPRALQGVDRIRIGDRVAIFPGCWLAAEGEVGQLTIGDDTYLGHDVHLHSIDPLTIGSRCVLADGAFVSSTDHARNDRSATHGTGPVTIGDDVFIGQRAVILGGVTIGDGATVGAHAVVTHDVAAGDVVAGVPARPVSSSSEGKS